jgi:hypothetical protein
MISEMPEKSPATERGEPANSVEAQAKKMDEYRYSSISPLGTTTAN